MIRDADPDIEAIAALEADNLGADAWSPALVADGAGDGYAVACIVADLSELRRIAVTPARRRTGVLLHGCGGG